ncbi:hypothetical protein [Vibrio quintilis]|uniref:Uncharacterized protein n=1 Tax=Vibrio quintilis TaxID=1117707 RepID=A0A1M7Z1N7_9VIBR|nr:hypothetical protein [Vibrio quintilis]SHO58791.1 hypothetical protein VQ7734_04563 [Vibrio quintilis]
MNVLKKSLLLIPLIWYALIWIGVVFGISSRTYGIEPQDAGLLGFLWFFVGTPLTFVTGVFYSLKNKYWWWLIAYLILGGGLIIAAYYARFS